MVWFRCYGYFRNKGVQQEQKSTSQAQLRWTGTRRRHWLVAKGRWRTNVEPKPISNDESSCQLLTWGITNYTKLRKTDKADATVLKEVHNDENTLSNLSRERGVWHSTTDTSVVRDLRKYKPSTQTKCSSSSILWAWTKELHARQRHEAKTKFRSSPCFCLFCYLGGLLIFIAATSCPKIVRMGTKIPRHLIKLTWKWKPCDNYNSPAMTVKYRWKNT